MATNFSPQARGGSDQSIEIKGQTVDIGQEGKQTNVNTYPISSCQPTLLDNTQLRGNDVPSIMITLTEFTYKWKDIGVALGFTIPEVESISSQSALFVNSPKSFLLEILTSWPSEAHHSHATIEALQDALQNVVGLSVVSEQLKTELQQLIIASNKQPSEMGAPLSFSQRPKPPDCIVRYADFFKGRYRSKPSLPQGDWPPSYGSQYSEITMVERDLKSLPDQERVEEILDASFHGKVDELAKNEKVIRSLDEVFIAQLEDNSSTSLKVLIEGVAGAGKTTLIQKSCTDWADGNLFQQFDLVVLITLRKEGLERAKSLEELLPGDDSDLKQKVVENIKMTSGKHLLFIFDGFDELSECVRTSNSIFLKIIQGELLHNCAVILTSRPYASDGLITDGWIHRHVKILGFTKEQIERYIMQNILDKSAAQSLMKSLNENMAITSVSSTPLSCSILLYIFKQMKFELPSTLTELFDAFIYSLVKRHAKRQKHEQKVNNLNNLPEPLNSQFKVLCKFAYDNLIQGKFVFISQDVKDICPVEDVEQNVLSLMTSATSFGIQSEETYYQFLHMTVQEYLAAKWIAMQSESMQSYFLCDNWKILNMKQVLIFFAGITKLKGYLFCHLISSVSYSGLMTLVLEGMIKSEVRCTTSRSLKEELRVCRPHPVHCPVTDNNTMLQTKDPFNIKPAGITVNNPFNTNTIPYNIISDTFNFEKTATRLVSQPSVSRDFSLDDKRHSAAQKFLCLASMIAETENCSLVTEIFKCNHIHGFHLDFCKLTPMDCSVVANFLSNCPDHLPLLHFNFCSLTGLSLEIFHKISTDTQFNYYCWNQCKEVQMNYNTPSFSASLSYLPQIPWFQNTKLLSLHGLQYPQDQPPEAFQLHALLGLKSLTDLTVTVERIPMNCMTDYEAVLLKFLKSLKYSNTLLNLTYNQSPPTTNCMLFVQLMLALSQSKLSLTLGHAQVVPSTANAVILPSKSCFKICWNGFVSAVKLADARNITVLEAYFQDFSLSSCSCQTLNIESRPTVTCGNCERNNPAVTYCSDCPSYLCESCLSKVHQQVRQFRTHKLNSIETDFSAVIRNSSLSVLDISECTLTDEVANHIGVGLADSKSLKQLNIKIFITEAVYIFRALEHNNSIKRLKISLAEGICSNKTVFMSLCQMLKSNKFLIVLDLSGFGVTDALAQHIACGLAENTSLQALNINSNELKCEGAGYILQSLQQNKSLRTLRVFNLYVQITSMPLTLSVATRAFDKQSLSLFVSSVVHNITMDKVQMFTGTGVLDLSGCSITDAEVEKIAAGLKGNSSLKELDLSENTISSIGAAHIFRSLEHNISLDKLLLSCNSQLAIGNSEMFTSTLQQMLTANKSLSVLDLSHCGITDAIMKSIGAGLAKTKSLKALNVDSEHLTYEGLKCLYQSLKQSKTIMILRRFDINLKVLYNPFGLGISTEHDTHAVLKFFESLEQENTVDKLVIKHKISRYFSQRRQHYSRRYNRHNNRSPNHKDDETLGCAMEKILTVSQTLRILDLQNCHCSDVLTGHIATALAKNCSIMQLILKGTCTCAVHIFQSLVHNTNLEKLKIQFSNLYLAKHNGEAQALGCAIQKMLTVNQTLKALNLHNYDFDDVITNHLATGLIENHSVNELILKVTCIGAVHIFKSLEYNTSLEELKLSRHSIIPDSDSRKAMGFAIQNMLTLNQTLRVLSFQTCSLDDVITNCMLTGLANNSSVKRLNLMVTSTGPGTAHIFEYLKHNTSLEELELTSNDYLYHHDSPGYAVEEQDALGCVVEEMLTVNQTLRVLNLQNYSLNDVITTHLSTRLADNSSIKRLNLKVTSIGAANIFEGLKCNTSLEELELISDDYPHTECHHDALDYAIESDYDVLGNAVQKGDHDVVDIAVQKCDHDALQRGDAVQKGDHDDTVQKGDNDALGDAVQERSDALGDTAQESDHDALGCVVEEMLTVNQTLRFLSLQSYHLSDITIGHIATGLTKNSSLKRLILKSNRITSIGAVHIFKSLEHNTSLRLEELDLSSNDFSHCQAATEDEALGCAVEGMLIVNHTLKLLNLQDCHLSNVIIDHIVSGLQFNDICSCKYVSISRSDAIYEALSHLNPWYSC